MLSALEIVLKKMNIQINNFVSVVTQKKQPGFGCHMSDNSAVEVCVWAAVSQL